MIDQKSDSESGQGLCLLDSLDRSILRKLQSDARTSYMEIARELGVAGGTIHARLARLREEGLIAGSKIELDYTRLGYTVLSFIGLKLVRAHDCGSLMEKLGTLPEVLEVHYTTGAYSLFIKVIVRSMKDLHALLFDRLQSFDEIQSTETFVILDTSIDRDLQL
jgi:Lrp/AsnC family transcriptional regulator for asnA, asnC and gidA